MYVHKIKQWGLNFLGRILLSYITFIVLTVILNHNNNNRLTSFLIVNFSAMVALVVLGMGFKKKLGFNILRIIFIGYFIKLLIGYLFWHFYLFPGYFTNPVSSFNFNHREYLITEWWMKNLAQQRIAQGYFYFSSKMLIIQHFVIHYVMSNLYLSGSFNPFDIAVQNSLFSIYTAVIILAISKHLGATSKQMKYALMIAIYQPFSMISSIIWRETVGQFFVALGGYLTLKSINKKIPVIIIFLLFASFSMLMERFIYFFFPVLAYAGYLIIRSKNKYNLLFLPIIFGAIIFFNNQFSLFGQLDVSYGSNLTNASLWIFLPINILRIFVGPFPWTQWFRFDDYTIFQIADYFQSVISICILIISIKVFKERRFLSVQNYSGAFLLFLLFIPFIFSALGTVDIHQGYMSTGIIFLIPSVILTSNYRKYNRFNLIIFMLFIVANILFILLGLSGMGAGSSFR